MSSFPEGTDPQGDADTQEFYFVGQDAFEAEVPPEWPRSIRKPRLLLAFGGGVPAVAPCAPAPPAPAASLAEIPVLSLPSHAASYTPTPTPISPLSSQPVGGHALHLGHQPRAGASSPPLTPFHTAAADVSMGDNLHGRWLQHPGPVCGNTSRRSSVSGISLCSASSHGHQVEEEEEGVQRPALDGGSDGFPGDTAAAHAHHVAARSHSRSSSFCLVHHPSSLLMSTAPSDSACGSDSCNSNCSRHSSSGSEVVNELMLQAEFGKSEAGTSVSAAPPDAASSNHVPYPTVSTVEASVVPMPPQLVPPPQQQQQEQQQRVPVATAPPNKSAPPSEVLFPSTPNPLFQPEQTALLSWRRNAWLHTERREPELLRRLLLSSGGEEGDSWSPSNLSSPLSGNTTAGATGRGRATAKHLVALTAVLALAVLLLHALHSHALAQQLAGDQEEVLLLQGTGRGAVHRAGHLGGRARYGPEPLRHAPGVTLHSGHGNPNSNGWEAVQAPRRLPRLRLRRLTLLLLTPHSAAAGERDPLQSGVADAEEIVWEEWEISRR